MKHLNNTTDSVNHFHVVTSLVRLSGSSRQGNFSPQPSDHPRTASALPPRSAWAKWYPGE